MPMAMSFAASLFLLTVAVLSTADPVALSPSPPPPPPSPPRPPRPPRPTAPSQPNFAPSPPPSPPPTPLPVPSSQLRGIPASAPLPTAQAAVLSPPYSPTASSPMQSPSPAKPTSSPSPTNGTTTTSSMQNQPPAYGAGVNTSHQNTSTAPIYEVGVTMAEELNASLYELLAQESNVVAVHLIHIPNTDRYLYMERPSGYHPDNSHNIAGSFDLVTREWIHLGSPDSLFCAGHTLLSNGSIIIIGGHVENAGFPAGIQHIRTYTDGQPSLAYVTQMLYPRWYPTATLLPDSQVLIMGGTQGVGAGTASNPYYEIWNPDTPDVTRKLLVNPTYLARVRQNYFPFNYVLPTGDLFNYCSATGWIMNPYTGVYMVPLPNRPISAVSPKTSYLTQYPYTGTSVMLPLHPENNYTVEVLIMGGQDVNANKNLSITACSESIRIAIKMPGSNGDGTPENYDFGTGWEQEFMGSPRVMPDSVLLPNGVVIVLNGAHEGLAGDSASGGGSKAFYPNFFAEMYDPYAPVGTRWSSLSRTQIARLYHSTAVLTTNGTVLVSGCDRCGKIVSDLPFSPPPDKAEYRNEIFYPPFWYDFARKPFIRNASTSVRYSQTFTVDYTGEQDPNVTVTGATLVAPSSTTHCFNENQRVVNLVVAAHDRVNKKLTVIAPPSPNHAPPQFYMLFLLNGYTYSKAHWIMLST